MTDTRAERLTYSQLLAIMNTDGRTQGFSFPYWNQKYLDGLLQGVAQGPRTGAAWLTKPSGAPTVNVTTGGILPAGRTYDVVQTFVDEYGNETDPSTVAVADTGTGVTDPAAAPTLGTPASAASGFSGGTLEVWFTWVDSLGGETLASPVASVDIPYRSGGLKSTVDVTLPSTPTAAGAAGANIYQRANGGNIVLAYSIADPAEDEATLDNVVFDCGRVLPTSNTTGAEHAIEITGLAANGGETPVLTRFYIRPTGSSWTSGAAYRLILSSIDEWDPATVSYPLTFTGASAELRSGFPPAVSLVKPNKLVDLATEVTGILGNDHLPATMDGVVYGVDLAKFTGSGVLNITGSGLWQMADSTPDDMYLHMNGGEAIIAGYGLLDLDTVTDLLFPAADPDEDRIDLVIINSSGVVQGPTENVACKGTPGTPPVAPATPAGALLLYQVTIPAAQTELAATLATFIPEWLPTLVSIDDELDLLSANIWSVSPDDAYAIDASSTLDFEISIPYGTTHTQMRALCAYFDTTPASADYDLELFTDSGRSVLAYKAEGITADNFVDLIPWPWFGGTTIYGTITNNVGEALTLWVDILYRR